MRSFPLSLASLLLAGCAEHVRLSPPWFASDTPGWSWTELVVGPATMEWEVDELVETLSGVYLG